MLRSTWLPVLTRAAPPARPVPPVLSGRDQEPPSPSKKTPTRSSAAMPKEYDATVAIRWCDVIPPSSQLDFGDARQFAVHAPEARNSLRGGLGIGGEALIRT